MPRRRQKATCPHCKRRVFLSTPADPAEPAYLIGHWPNGNAGKRCVGSHTVPPPEVDPKFAKRLGDYAAYALEYSP